MHQLCIHEVEQAHFMMRRFFRLAADRGYLDPCELLHTAVRSYRLCKEFDKSNSYKPFHYHPEPHVVRGYMFSVAPDKVELALARSLYGSSSVLKERNPEFYPRDYSLPAFTGVTFLPNHIGFRVYSSDFPPDFAKATSGKPDCSISTKSSGYLDWLLGILYHI